MAIRVFIKRIKRLIKYTRIQKPNDTPSIWKPIVSLKTSIEILNNDRRVQRDCYKLPSIDR